MKKISKTSKTMLCLILSLVIICGAAQINIFALDNLSTDFISAQDISAYQSVLDKLNSEYNYSMTFDPALFSRNSTSKSLTGMSLEEFEATLRAEIEADIAVNNETAASVAALGDVEWTPIPYLGKSYELPVNVSCMNSQVAASLYLDSISFRNDVCERNADEVNSISNVTADKTITSIQPRQDPTGNSALLLTADISVNDNWLYSNVQSFSYMRFMNGAYYMPTSASCSLIDSKRTATTTFTCNYYSETGVLISSNSSIYREFNTTGDCITNWPNYTIPKSVTNQTYRLIDSFDGTQNCAGYAWNYSSYVDMPSLGITYNALNICSNLTQLRSLVKTQSETFMFTHGINASVISAYDTAINTSTQYRVVMRVGYYDNNDNGTWDFSANPGSDEWDYHWWIQLGDGSWADKRGSFPSRITPLSNIYTNPEISIWRWATMYFGELKHDGFYSSAPVYYKITG